jgi:hypothetical protein
MKSAEVSARAYWLLAASLLPWFIVGGVALVPERWAEAHVNIHNDAPLILAFFCFWVGTMLVAVLGVPWGCWQLVAQTDATPRQRRRWRTAFIVGNVFGCVAFLLYTVLRLRSEAERSYWP